MLENEIFADAFERIKQSVHKTLDNASDEDVKYMPSDSSNSIAWLVWHLSRVQDHHISELSGHEQVWLSGWVDKFDLPFDKSATGYGQVPKEVAAVKSSSKMLTSYYDSVHAATLDWLKTLSGQDYPKIVDRNWKPPVTLAARLVSVIADDLQHAGQAAYLLGLINKAK